MLERVPQWLAAETPSFADLALLGAPINAATFHPSKAWTTPAAFRSALSRFPTWDAGHQNDLSTLAIRDLGDVQGDEDDSDLGEAARARLQAKVAETTLAAPVLVVIGGDNSITRPALLGRASTDLTRSWGLITLDARHDLGEDDTEAGAPNNSVVGDVIRAGLPGNRIAQIGIHEFGNVRSAVDRARTAGIRTFAAEDVRRNGMAETVQAALESVRSAGARQIYFSLDVGVIDRAFAPASPGSMPCGLLPGAAVQAAYLLGAAQDCTAMDINEVDAGADIAGMTIRLMAHLFVSFCSGMVARKRMVKIPN